MNRSALATLPVAVVLVAAFAVALSPRAAAVPSSSVEPPATAGPSASPVAPAAFGPAKGWPVEASAKPTAEEWKSATELALIRPNADCTTHRVREWLRVRCLPPAPGVLKSVRVLAGPTDAELSAPELSAGQSPVGAYGAPTPRGAHLTFAVRPGDRRLYEMVLIAHEGRFMFGEDAFAVVSVVWLAGEEGPTIVID